MIMTWQERLASLIEERGWDLAELARRSGIKPRTLQNYLYTGSEPSISRAAQIAKAFNISLDELVFGEPSAVSRAGGDPTRAVIGILIGTARTFSTDLQAALDGAPARAVTPEGRALAALLERIQAVEAPRAGRPAKDAEKPKGA